MSDVTQIQQQARRSFFQWHVFLILKRKKLEATLADAGYRPQMVRDIEADLPPVVDSDELALLKDIGLPVPDDLKGYDLPEQQRVQGVRFYFLATSAFDNEHDTVLGLVRQLSNGSYEHREIMRVDSSDQDYLSQATTQLNQALSVYAVPLVLNASFVWSAFHGAVILDWIAVSSKLLGINSTDADTVDFEELELFASDEPRIKKGRRRNFKGRNLLGNT